MRTMYTATEGISLLILMILLYANIYELNTPSKKKNIFNGLLVVNILLVLADALTWMNSNWKESLIVFKVLLSLTYILPFLMMVIFAQYIYLHITEKVSISYLPFRIYILLTIAAGFTSIWLCVTEKMFTIVEGIWHPGDAESLYYLYYLVALFGLSCIIFANGKKMGRHDMLASLLFCFVPIISILIPIPGIEASLAVPFVAVDALIIYIMLQSESESKLLYESNTDELTGLLNRRSYEDSLMEYPDIPKEDNFVYASIDINGLKEVNDTLGHAAGDELIRGASYCLKRTFGNYGRVFRTGGDEFVSIFFADKEKLNFLMEDVEMVSNNWSGDLVKCLSFSVGCVTKEEYPEKTVRELAVIADQRMYKNKEQYYSAKGVDRRGQNEAHKVLCSLYSKILEINLTNDSFSVINMNLEEQTRSLGYSESISVWLQDFGKSGGVHPEDLDAYLEKTDISHIKEYFNQGKTSLTIQFRRKYENVYKQVVMEIIPTKQYSAEHQTFFLYVKNIDN